MPNDIPGVIAQMQQMDAALPASNGLKWFNRLYLMVTQAVDGSPPTNGWQDAAWLTKLDVVFAQYYFDAVANYAADPSSVPASWCVLFQSAANLAIEPIQFALAGMNAHINHDLALALLDTNKQLNLTPDLQSPEHGDFEYVNQLLKQVLPTAVCCLQSGILGQAAVASGKAGALFALWDVKEARDFAWDFSSHLATLNPVQQQVALTLQDKLTGALGRALLAL
jgi:hypothetical protein